ncbi:DUF805 domain-containing protein [Companilactobacillus keshanensis]|uniref:DUF805 domain-containing protein n=1 Tax=Companilactobacillus keshanensis TaxID=2486003 RepID=A0ABW4BWB0_9LACO|nr:hypothetical protein [Companilactobacillus keshanensis]
MRRVSGAQIFGWIFFWISNLAIVAVSVISTIHPNDPTIIPHDFLSAGFALGMFLFFVVFIQGMAGVAIKRLHDENYWSIVLLIIGIFFNWFYVVSAIWGMILNQKSDDVKSNP